MQRTEIGDNYISDQPPIFQVSFIVAPFQYCWLLFGYKDSQTSTFVETFT